MRESVWLSRLDCEIIARLAKIGNVPATVEQFLQTQEPSWQPLERCRERDECLEKLQTLGLVR